MTLTEEHPRDGTCSLTDCDEPRAALVTLSGEMSQNHETYSLQIPMCAIHASLFEEQADELLWD